MKLFNPDSRIMIFLSRVADLVILNILFSFHLLVLQLYVLFEHVFLY